MKIRNLSRIFPFLLALLLAVPLGAQVQNPNLENPKYGADTAMRRECLKQTSFYQGFYKQKNYRDALRGWAIVYNICPMSSENIFIRGIRMIKMQLDTIKQDSLKQVMLDSLMRIYDKRVECYGKAAKNLTQKALDLYSYNSDRVEEVEQILQKVKELDLAQMDPQAMVLLMQCNIRLYGEKKRSAEEVITLYSDLSSSVAKQLAASPEDAELQRASEALDAQFTSVGVASCADIVRIFGPKLEKAPNDLDLAKTIHMQLSALRCTDEPLYGQALKVMFDAEPTANLALELARVAVSKKQGKEADGFYAKALELELDNGRNAQICLEYAAFVASEFKEFARARQLAYEALKKEPRLGQVYMFIAGLYAQTKGCGSSQIENASVFWAAVDKYNQAKALDPSLASDCNKQIAYLSQYFPTKEQVFFLDMTPGDSFTVPCWINEKTTIRTSD